MGAEDQLRVVVHRGVDASQQTILLRIERLGGGAQADHAVHNVLHNETRRAVRLVEGKLGEEQEGGLVVDGGVRVEGTLCQLVITISALVIPGQQVVAREQGLVVTASNVQDVMTGDGLEIVEVKPLEASVHGPLLDVHNVAH